MNNLIFTFKRTRLFFAVLIVMLCAGLMMVAGPLASPEIFINHHSFWMNVFFVNYTFLGNGIFVATLALFFIFYLKKKATGILLGAGFILPVLVIQLIKNMTSNQPLHYFTEQLQNLFLYNEYSATGHAVFPSSYTAVAFSAAAILALKSSSFFYQLLLLAAAALVGYSRVYLQCNAVVDVFAGAVIGSVSGISLYYFRLYKITLRTTIKRLHKVKRSSRLGEIQPG